MALQDIKRGLAQPRFTVPDGNPAWHRELVVAYQQLAQQLQFVQTAFQVYQRTVAAAAATLPLTLTTPMPNTSYSPLAILDWAAFAYVTAISTTAVTFTFSVVAPGGGGTVRIIVAN